MRPPDASAQDMRVRDMWYGQAATFRHIVSTTSPLTGADRNAPARRFAAVYPDRPGAHRLRSVTPARAIPRRAAAPPRRHEQRIGRCPRELARRDVGPGSPARGDTVITLSVTAGRSNGCRPSRSRRSASARSRRASRGDHGATGHAAAARRPDAGPAARQGTSGRHPATRYPGPREAPRGSDWGSPAWPAPVSALSPAAAHTGPGPGHRTAGQFAEPALTVLVTVFPSIEPRSRRRDECPPPTRARLERPIPTAINSARRARRRKNHAGPSRVIQPAEQLVCSSPAGIRRIKTEYRHQTRSRRGAVASAAAGEWKLADDHGRPATPDDARRPRSAAGRAAAGQA